MEWTTESMLRHMLENPRSGRAHKDSFILQDILPFADQLPDPGDISADNNAPVYFRTTARLVSRSDNDVSCERAIYDATVTDELHGRTLITAVDGIDPHRMHVLCDILRHMLFAYGAHTRFMRVGSRYDQFCLAVVELLDDIYSENPMFLSSNHVLDGHGVAAIQIPIVSADDELRLNIAGHARAIMETRRRGGADAVDGARALFESVLDAMNVTFYEQRITCITPYTSHWNKHSVLAQAMRSRGDADQRLPVAAMGIEHDNVLGPYTRGEITDAESQLRAIHCRHYDYTDDETLVFTEDYLYANPSTTSQRARYVSPADAADPPSPDVSIEELDAAIVERARNPTTTMAAYTALITNQLVMRVDIAMRNHAGHDIVAMMLGAERTRVQWIVPMLQHVLQVFPEDYDIRMIRIVVYMCWVLSKQQTCLALAQSLYTFDLVNRISSIAAQPLVQHTLWRTLDVQESMSPYMLEGPEDMKVDRRLRMCMERNAWCLGAYAEWYMRFAMTNDRIGRRATRFVWSVAIAATQFSSQRSVNLLNAFARRTRTRVEQDTLVSILRQGRIESLPWLVRSPIATKLLEYGAPPFIEILMRMYPHMKIGGVLAVFRDKLRTRRALPAVRAFEARDQAAPFSRLSVNATDSDDDEWDDDDDAWAFDGEWVGD